MERPKWNKIVDVPPPIGESVLACVKSMSGKHGLAIAHLDQRGEWILSTGQKMTWAAVVTHWIHIPELPADIPDDPTRSSS